MAEPIPKEEEEIATDYDKLEAKETVHIVESGSVSYQKGQDETSYLLEKKKGYKTNKQVSY